MAPSRLTFPIAGLVLALLLVATVATLAHHHVTTLDRRAGSIAHTHDVLQTTAWLEDAFERVAGGHVPTREQVAALRDKLRAITKDDATQRRRLDQLEPLIATRLSRFESTDEAVLDGRIRAILADVEAEARALLEMREAAYRSEARVERRIMIGAFTASAVAVFLAFLLLRREVLRRSRSEHRLEIIVDSISDAVIATDAAGRITHMNRVAAQLTGWPVSEARGRSFSDVFHVIDETTREARRDSVGRALAERAITSIVDRIALVARNGDEHPIAVSTAPVLDANDDLHGAVIVFRDVAVTRAVEERFRHLVAAAPDAIVIVEDGRITTINDQVTALFGYSASELEGESVEILLPERIRDRHRKHRRGFESRPALRAMGAGMSLVGRRKDGTELPIEVALSPLVTPQGTQVIAAVRDVTRRRDLERFRDEYVGYISHDLKNPLSVIALQARQLARVMAGHRTSEEAKALQVISENAAFIDHLVRELLEMAYVESENIELHVRATDLAPFLDALLDRTVSSSDRERVSLEIGQRGAAAIDAPRIERVVVNFVQNALKYSPPGSPVVVRLDADADRVEVSVSDQGPGVAIDERLFVFEKYKRTATARSKDGVGLGLYISRKIIEAHGGEIGVDAAEGGRGARFFFRLPRVADPPVATAAVAVQAKPADAGVRGLKVLLVDDEANALSALSSLLDDEGLLVRAARSGEEALALASSVPPDVAVVDVQMPGMSGLELLERLRERRPDLPAVIMTGFLSHHSGVAKARANGSAYVGKPVDVDELLRAIARVAGGVS